jgi:uncharacterized protein YukE
VAKANPVASRQKFDANPQGVGYDQMAGLIRYYDRILGGYEEDVTGNPSTLTGTSHMLSIQAPAAQKVGGDITSDATLVGHAWNGKAYNAFKSSATTKATSIGTVTGLMQRTGNALENVSQELSTTGPEMKKIRTDFLELAGRIAVQTDLNAAEAPNPAAARVERWKGFQQVNQLGLDTVKIADTRARKFDKQLDTIRAELTKVERDAGGDTHNPLAQAPAQPAVGNPVARLIHRNGFEDSGPEVRSLQQMLTGQTGANGQPLLAPGQVSGTWDAATQRAVDNYMRQNNIAPFDASIADPSRLPPRFQALWPIMMREAQATGIDPVYMMAAFDREHSDDGVAGRAMPDHLVGQGAINRRQLGGLHGYGIPQVDSDWHAPFLEQNAYGFDPETAVGYAFRLLRSNLGEARVNGDMHKALNRYNSSGVTDAATTNRDYGLDTISRARVFRNMLYGLDRTQPTAATPRPDPTTAPPTGTEGYKASSEVLGRLRKDMLDSAFKGAELVSWLRNLRVAPAAFGSRPSSEQTSDAYHRAVASVANKLRLDTKTVAELAETVLDSANGYQGDDELVRDEILGLKPRGGMPGR